MKSFKHLVLPSHFSKRHAIIVTILVAVTGTAIIANSLAYRTVGAGAATINAYCDFSHRSNDDPIVFPGRTGAAHSHDFFGATKLDAFSTPQSIQKEPTSCLRPNAPTSTQRADKSAYWVPTLYVNDQPVQPVRLTAKYGAGYRKLADIKPFPAGLQVIAGTATGGPSTVNNEKIWEFRCHVTPTVADGNGTVAPTCAEHTDRDGRFEVQIRFPDCWDGVNLDSANHKSHMAYSSQKTRERPIKECPASHPVLVPTLSLIIAYPTTGGPTTRLSSGGLNTAHADFVNGWDQAHLSTLVNACLKIDNYCGGGDRPVAGHAGNDPRDIDSQEIRDYLQRTGQTTTPAPLPAPELNFFANTTTVNAGGSASLVWSSSNASSCTASGAWTGNKSINGSQATGRLTASSTYTLVCTGTGGTITKNVRVNVAEPAPAPDTIKPVVSILTPANGATVSSTVNIAANATDAKGVTKVELYINGVLKATDVAAPYTFSWNTASYASGRHTLVTKAYDAAGNVGTATIAANIPAPSKPKEGDLNGDGKVDMLDISRMANNWRKTNVTREQGDLNGDGIVNILDLAIIVARWERQ